MNNFRIYGHKTGWEKITIVNKEEQIPPVLKDMLDVDYKQFIIIKHDFDMNCDIPYDHGTFYKGKIKRLKR